MKVILRNLQPSTALNFNFGAAVTPQIVSIPALKSVVVETELSVLEFRKIASVAIALGAGNLSLSARGGMKVIN